MHKRKMFWWCVIGLVVVVLPGVVFAEDVDIVGDDSNHTLNVSCVLGNIFDATGDKYLKEQAFWLAFDGSVDLHFYVYKSRAHDESGTYDLISESTRSFTGGGLSDPDWYGVSYFGRGVPIEKNHYYIIAYGVIFENVKTYWATPEGEPVSFGYQTHGTEFPCTDPAADPISSPPLQPKRFHQRLVTAVPEPASALLLLLGVTLLRRRY